MAEDEKSGSGAGLSSTGTTADQMSSGERNPGTTYGDPTGSGTASHDETSGDDESTTAASVEDAEK
jgi:hypothetical protein